MVQLYAPRASARARSRSLSLSPPLLSTLSLSLSLSLSLARALVPTPRARLRNTQVQADAARERQLLDAKMETLGAQLERFAALAGGSADATATTVTTQAGVLDRQEREINRVAKSWSASLSSQGLAAPKLAPTFAPAPAYATSFAGPVPPPPAPPVALSPAVSMMAVPPPPMGPPPPSPPLPAAPQSVSSAESEATINALKEALAEATEREAQAKAAAVQAAQREAGLVEELRIAQLAGSHNGAGGGPHVEKKEEPTDLRTVLHDFYAANVPEKVANLDAILKHYAGKEASLVRTIEEKYSVKLNYKPPPRGPKIIKVPVAVSGTGVNHWLIIMVLLVACGTLLYQTMFQSLVLEHQQACLANGSMAQADSATAHAAVGACPVGVSEEVTACLGAAPIALEAEQALNVVGKWTAASEEAGWRALAATEVQIHHAWENREVILKYAADQAAKVLDDPGTFGRGAVAYVRGYSDRAVAEMTSNLMS